MEASFELEVLKKSTLLLRLKLHGILLVRPNSFVFDPTASESEHLDYSEGRSHSLNQVFDTRKLDQKELILT
jgi:hypothetical protein